MSVTACASDRLLDEQPRVLAARVEALTLACEQMIEGWVRAVDLRSQEPAGHTRRVTEMAVQLAAALGVPVGRLDDIRRGALLHDIGKAGVPEAVLVKPGRLDPAELALIRQHPSQAREMLEPIAFLRTAIEIPWCHHERWDGRGYPRGLSGSAIPLAARVFSVVDVWDALRTNRPYHRGCSREDARAFLRANAGAHFDPSAAAVFLELEEAGLLTGELARPETTSAGD